MATQGSQEVGEEVVVEAVNGNVDPRTETSTEQVAASTVAGSSVAGGEHMFIETEVYTTTVDYVGSTELVRTDNEPNSKQDQQQEVLEQVRLMQRLYASGETRIQPTMVLKKKNFVYYWYLNTVFY